uniref:H15 domain-containing protein n=1 Tax=Culex tarsalis TaxID=7177 RepID=A0A1Q3F0F0_CULTA
MSSSSDEAGVNPPAPPATVLLAKARASSPESSDEELTAVKPWLDLVLEAFINIPTEDAEKGISIRKVQTYLKEKHRVTKAKMKRNVYPALRLALARKYITKTTALKTVVMGSARLNPAYAISRLRRPDEVVATEDEKAGAGGGRKRKAASSTDEDGPKTVKRRIPFAKVN